MKIKINTDDLLHIEQFSKHIVLFAWSCGLIVTGKVLYLILSGRFQPESTALIASCLIFFFGGAAFGKKESFLIKKDDRVIHWTRQGLFGTEQGLIPFEEIKGIVVQKATNGGNYSYRVAVETLHGPIPVSCAYTAGAEEACKQMQKTITEAIL